MNVNEFFEVYESLDWLSKKEVYAYLKYLVWLDRHPNINRIVKWIKRKGERNMMWKCKRCQEKFRDENAYYEKTSKGYSTMECPKCHSDVVTLLTKCSACGEYEITSRVPGLCKDCLKEAETRFKLFKDRLKADFQLSDEQWEAFMEGVQ